MPQRSSPAEKTAALRTRTRTDACGREAAADGAAAEVADATTTPPFEAISDSAARTTWRRCIAAAAAQGAVDASRRDARVAQAGSCGGLLLAVAQLQRRMSVLHQQTFHCALHRPGRAGLPARNLCSTVPLRHQEATLRWRKTKSLSKRFHRASHASQHVTWDWMLSCPQPRKSTWKRALRVSFNVEGKQKRKRSQLT